MEVMLKKTFVVSENKYLEYTADHRTCSFVVNLASEGYATFLAKSYYSSYDTVNIAFIDFVCSEGQTLLIQMEDAAKAAGKGKWGSPEEVANHVRDIKWQVENTRHFVESNKNKEIDGMLHILP